MLQASELRIGNFILDDEGKVGKVEALQSDLHVKYMGVNDGPITFTELPDTGVMYGSDRYEGILLTPEILKAAGFEMDGTCQVPEWVHPSGFRFFDWYGTECCSVRMMGSFDVDLHYVHQLQNFFFALTGQELDIKLPVDGSREVESV